MFVVCVIGYCCIRCRHYVKYDGHNIDDDDDRPKPRT